MGKIIVYKYGLRPPIENAELVKEQMIAAHRYWNTLVSIENGRRDALRGLYKTAGDEVALEETFRKAEAEVDVAVAEIAKARAKVRNEHVKNGETPHAAKRGARVTPPALAEKLKAAREARKQAFTALVTYRKQVQSEPKFTLEAEAINQRAAELVRSAREHCGLYWGSYLLVEDAMQAAKKAPLYDFNQPAGPRFKAWRSWQREVLGEVLEGRLGVQIQAQADKPSFLCKDAYGKDTRLRIENVPDRFSRPQYEGVWNILRLRIGSKGREPIFAAWPMKMDRPLPEDGIIKRVNVSMRHVWGGRQEWTATFIVEHDGPATRSRGRPPVSVRHKGEGVVAVNFGWREMGEELRIATWRSLDDKFGDVRLSAELLSDLRFADSVRSRRDQEFDRARAVLAEWLRVGDAPEWLKKEAEALAQWKSSMRLAALVQRWAKDRVAGDEVAFEALEKWRYHDRHLWEWEAEQRERALRRRDDLYKRIACILSTSFKTLVIEDFDIREVAKKSSVTGKYQNEHAASNRHLAAPGELRMILKRAFEARKGEVVVLPAEDNTKTCRHCGTVENFDAAASVERKPACSGCGAEWDQDDNNVQVQLQYYLQRKEKEQKAATNATSTNPSPTSVSRWDRVKQKSTERRSRVAEAKKALAQDGSGSAPP